MGDVTVICMYLIEAVFSVNWQIQVIKNQSYLAFSVIIHLIAHCFEILKTINLFYDR